MYNEVVKRRILWVVFLLVFLLLVASGAWAWLSAPRLLGISPAPGSTEVPVGAPLRLNFSQPLRNESLQEHLKIEPPRAGAFRWEGNTLVFTPDQQWPGGVMITVTLEAGVRAAGWPGLPTWQEMHWSFRTSQTLLAYLWPAGSPSDLYALDPVSGEIQQWTEEGDILDFSASQDGTYLYISRQNRQGGSDILRLDRLTVTTQPGAAAEMLVACPDALCRSPQPSPDGRWLAYERAPLEADPPTTQVWLLPLDGGEPRLAGDGSHRTSQPAWAQPEWLAYYDRDENAYLLSNLESGARWRLPNQTGEAASWEAQGRAFVVAEILFETGGMLPDYASSHLMRFDLPSESIPGEPLAHDLTQDVALEDASPVYAPDGSQIAFARKYLDLARWSPGRQLWVMSADGKQARQLTDEPLYNHYDFAWSTDGTQIAYVRFHQTALTLPPELWIINADGSNPIQLVIGGYAPQWIP